MFKPHDPLTWGIWIAILLPRIEIMTLFPWLFLWNIGFPSFLGLLVILVCLTVLRAEKRGYRVSLVDSFLLVLPLCLLFLGLTIILHYPNWWDTYATLFAKQLGLGAVLTNRFVAYLAVVLLVFWLPARLWLKKKLATSLPS
jgi:hypothetical protein